VGYSCTKDASDMLGLVRHTLSDHKTSNGLQIGADTWGGQQGRTYFYEIGRENADGSITGTVFENIDGSHARRYGSFKIAADGRVVRFPLLTRDQRIALAFKFAELRRTNPALLASYSYGSI
jgi:hypothetical protein